LSNFLYVRTKTQENFLPIFVFEEAKEAKIWSNPEVQRGSRCNHSPANEAEGQTTTSASRTKLLENGRDSETSTTRESSAYVDDDFLFLASRGMVSKMPGEQRSLNSSNILPMPPTKSSK